MTENELVKIIKTDLVSKITKDLSKVPFRIFREEDLHACTYYHLRKHIEKDPTWEILNEPQLKGLKRRNRSRHPDLLLMKDGISKFIIELKFNYHLEGIQKKDQQVLKKSVKKKRWAKKAFFIQVIVDPKRSSKRGVWKNRNAIRSIYIDPEMLNEYKRVFEQRHSVHPRPVQIARNIKRRKI